MVEGKKEGVSRCMHARAVTNRVTSRVPIEIDELNEKDPTVIQYDSTIYTVGIFFDTLITNMSLVCKRCHKKLGDNRRSFAGHMQHCMKFKEYQQRIFATLGNIGSTVGPSEESRRTNTVDMEIDVTETETQGKPRGSVFVKKIKPGKQSSRATCFKNSSSATE